MATLLRSDGRVGVSAWASSTRVHRRTLRFFARPDGAGVASLCSSLWSSHRGASKFESAFTPNTRSVASRPVCSSFCRRRASGVSTEPWCMASTGRAHLVAAAEQLLLLLDTSLLRSHLPPCSSCCPWPGGRTLRLRLDAQPAATSARPWRRRRRSWRRWHQCRSLARLRVWPAGTPPWCSTVPY